MPIFRASSASCGEGCRVTIRIGVPGERDVISLAASSPFIDRHLKVEHDNVKLFFVKFRNGFPSVGRFIAHFPIILGFQKISQCATHHRVVIHREDAGPRRSMRDRLFYWPSLSGLAPHGVNDCTSASRRSRNLRSLSFLTSFKACL